MNSGKRIITATAVLIIVVVAIVLIELYREKRGPFHDKHTGPKIFSKGCLPIYSDAILLAKFCGEDSSRLQKTGFIDKHENKLQEGWLLRDVISIYLKGNTLSNANRILIESSIRGKSAELTWKDINDSSNRILLTPSKQGALKLASTMKGLDTREKWVQDVDKITLLRP